ncbi:hypothetical protein [Paenibacillus cymbidii]|uniref:hypothetical protein n=1 Tax=Paenibacillus cymbidii TaxID=1639034 RepID=UPI0010820C57|nr:hypothetical protein [Paenibacillus cymbidii]
MSIRNLLIALGGLLLFGLLLVIAWYVQSAYFIYAASAVPIFIVPFLPDLRSRQTLRVSAKDDSVRMFVMDPEGQTKPEFLVIRFIPGVINWHKGIVYFTLNELPTETLPSYRPEGAPVSVLKHDLIAPRRKTNRYGIRLQQIVERTAGLSFTTKEIDRFVIRIADLQELREAVTFQAATPARNMEA